MTKIVSFKCPEPLVQLMMQAVRDLGFSSISELIREAIREYLERHYIRTKRMPQHTLPRRPRKENDVVLKIVNVDEEDAR